MICQRIGFPPISIIGLGFNMLSSDILVPNPPASITTFINTFLALGKQNPFDFLLKGTSFAEFLLLRNEQVRQEYCDINLIDPDFDHNH